MYTTVSVLKLHVHYMQRERERGREGEREREGGREREREREGERLSKVLPSLLKVLPCSMAHKRTWPGGEVTVLNGKQ